jgi:HEAT repeat protein
MSAREVLKSADNDEKVRLLQSFFKREEFSPDADLINAVKDLCSDSDIAVRFWAKKVLNKAQKKSDPKTETISQSGDGKPEQEIDTAILFKKLKDAQSHFVAIEILRKIFKKRSAKDLAALLEYLQSCTDTIVIAYLTKNLGIHYPGEELFTRLVPYLKNQDDRVVANTIEGLEAIKSPKNIVIFSQLLQHPSHRVKANAAKALSTSRPEDSTQILTKMLEKRDTPHFVLAACAAIKEIPRKEYIPYLIDIIADPLFFEGALKALKSIGGEETATYLDAIIQDFEGDQKEQLQKALQEINSAGKNKKIFAQEKVENFSVRSVQADSNWQKKITNFLSRFREVILKLTANTRWNSLIKLIEEYLPIYLQIYMTFSFFAVATAFIFYVFPFAIFGLVPLLSILLLLLSTPILFLAGFAGLFYPTQLGFASKKRAISVLWGSSFFSLIILLMVVKLSVPPDSNVSQRQETAKRENSGSWLSGGFFDTSLESKISRGENFTLEEVRAECERRSKNGDYKWEEPFSKAMTGRTVNWSGWVDSVTGDLAKQNYQVNIDIDDPSVGFSVSEIRFIVDENLASKIRPKSKIAFRGRIVRADTTLSTWNIFLENVEINSGMAASTVPGFKSLATLKAEAIALEKEMNKRSEENKKLENEILRKLEQMNQLSYDDVCSLLKPVSFPSMRLKEAFQGKSLRGTGWVNRVSGWWAPYTCYVDLDSPSAGSYHVYFEISEAAAKNLKNGSHVSFSGVIKGFDVGVFSGSSFLIELKRVNVY